jgi:SAM-dependent methyltransferase
MTTTTRTDRWNGPEGRLWAAEHERFDRMGAPLERALLEVAALRPGERVLDIGCGAGATTLAAAWEVAPNGRATGIDRSTPLAALARRRTAGMRGVDVVVADAQTYPFPTRGLDVLISRNGLMLFTDPPAAFANLRRALRDDGRLAFVTWADSAANGWSAIPNAAVAAHIALPPPSEDGPCAFSLSDPARIHALLGGAGFDEIAPRRVDTRLWVASDVGDAVAFFERSAGDLRRHVPEGLVRSILLTLRASLLPYAEADGVYVPAAAWVVTAKAAAPCTG